MAWSKIAADFYWVSSRSDHPMLLIVFPEILHPQTTGGTPARGRGHAWPEHLGGVRAGKCMHKIG